MAGFDIVGVDIQEQPEYPFEFIQADALSVSDMLDEFDLVHASPPCQGYTNMRNSYSTTRTGLIPEVRTMLDGRQYVIENVVGARRFMRDPVLLRGSMFSMPLDRPRLFECTFYVAQPPSSNSVWSKRLPVYGDANGRVVKVRKDGSELRAWKDVREGATAMSCGWMEQAHTIKEAIPPQYTYYLALWFLKQHYGWSGYG